MNTVNTNLTIKYIVCHSIILAHPQKSTVEDGTPVIHPWLLRKKHYSENVKNNPGSTATSLRAVQNKAGKKNQPLLTLIFPQEHPPIRMKYVGGDKISS